MSTCHVAETRACAVRHSALARAASAAARRAALRGEDEEEQGSAPAPHACAPPHVSRCAAGCNLLTLLRSPCPSTSAAPTGPAHPNPNSTLSLTPALALSPGVLRPTVAGAGPKTSTWAAAALPLCNPTPTLASILQPAPLPPPGELRGTGVRSGTRLLGGSLAIGSGLRLSSRLSLEGISHAPSGRVVATWPEW